jgi:DNA-binding MarR family transcriptional regulator
MSAKDNNPTNEKFLDDINRHIHEPARLLIVSHLYVISEADFLFLEKQTGLTRGNLSSHLSKLEEVGYVEITKEFIDKIPHTIIRLTRKGRKAFEVYKENMKKFLES